MRRVYQPSLDDSLGAVPIDNGGSSSKKLATAVQYLGLLTNGSKGVASGSADLDANGKVKHVNLPDSIISEVLNVSGPVALKVNQTGIYTITDYDSATSYDVAATSGVVTRTGDTITYTAGTTPGNGGFTINGKAYVIPVTYYSVVTPNITAPSNGATGQSGTVNFTSNAFAMEGGTDTHYSSDWQVATDSGFSNVVSSVANSTSNKLTYTASGLNPNTTYYARVRYKGVVSDFSSWSPVISFSTATSFAPNAPTLTNPTNGQTSVALSTTFTSSAFNSPGVDTHYSSDWQIATDSGFSNIVKSATDDTVNKLSWLVTGLVDLTVYYARVRHKGATFGYGAWSSTVSFTTIQANSINTPNISIPANAADGVSLSPSLTASAFSVTGGSDTHQSSDWQMATDSGFTNIVKSTTGDTVNKTTWSVTGLSPNTTYYVRVRYKGTSLPYSAWSTVNQFNTIHVNTPSITSPSNGATGLIPTMTLSGSAFSVTGASDTHLSSDWQIATDSGFTNIVSSLTADTTNKTSWTVNLSLNTTYYIRVRYKGTTYGNSNWSTTVSFSTIANYTPNTPGITSPTTGATNQGPTVSFSSSAFAMNGGSATHTSSDWQIATDSGFATIVFSTTNDTTNKTSWTSPNLTANTTYYARVRYLASNGIYSGWSTTISFKTKVAYVASLEEAIIPYPGSLTGTKFGYQISMDATGTRAIVGASQVYNGGYKTGGAYIFVRSGSSWALEKTILGGGSTVKLFGESVKISPNGDFVAIGIPGFYHSYYSTTCGGFCTYYRYGTDWYLGSSTLGSDNFALYAQSDPNYGYSIDMSDDCKFIIIGGPNYYNLTGAFQIYYNSTPYSNTGYTRVTTLSGSFGTNARFGMGIAISGDGTRCIVSSPDKEKCVIYAILGTYPSISLSTEVTDAPTGIITSNLGYVCDINYDGSVVVMGSAWSSGPGFVRIGRRSGTNWTFSYITPSNGHSGDWFGRGVSITPDGTKLAVSAMMKTNGSLLNAGAAYIFQYNGTNWLEAAQLLPSDSIQSGYFGRYIDITDNGDRVFVGNENRDKCYVYK